MWSFFQGLGQNLINAINTMFGWLGSQLGGIFTWLGSEINALFNSINSFLSTLLQPILWVVQGFYYLLQQVFSIVVLVIQVIFGLFKVVYSVIIGIFSTFSQLLSYSGSSSYFHVPAAYQTGFGYVTGFMNTSGLNTLPAVICVFIWISAAIAVIKIGGGK